jgi:hypothetical protein
MNVLVEVVEFDTHDSDVSMDPLIAHIVASCQIELPNSKPWKLDVDFGFSQISSSW